MQSEAGNVLDRYLESLRTCEVTWIRDMASDPSRASGLEGFISCCIDTAIKRNCGNAMGLIILEHNNPAAFLVREEVKRRVVNISIWALENDFTSVFIYAYKLATLDEKVTIAIAAAVTGNIKFASDGSSFSPVQMVEILVGSVASPFFFQTAEFLGLNLNDLFLDADAALIALLEASIKEKNNEIAYFLLAHYDFFENAKFFEGIDLLFPNFYAWTYADFAQDAMLSTAHPKSIGHIVEVFYQQIDFAAYPALGMALLDANNTGNNEFPVFPFNERREYFDAYGKIMRDLNFTVEMFKRVEIPWCWLVSTAMESGIEAIIEYVLEKSTAPISFIASMKFMQASIPFALRFKRFRAAVLEFGSMHEAKDVIARGLSFADSPFDLQNPIGQTIHKAIFANAPNIIRRLPANDSVLGLMHHKSCRVLLMSYILTNYNRLYLQYLCLNKRAVHFNLRFLLDPSGHEYMEEFFEAQGDLQFLCNLLFTNRKNDPAVLFALAYASPYNQERFTMILRMLVEQGLTDLHTVHCLLTNFTRRFTFQLECSSEPQQLTTDQQWRDDLLAVVQSAAATKYTALLQLVVEGFNLDSSALLQLPILKPFHRDIGAIIGRKYHLDQVWIWKGSFVLVKLADLYCSGDLASIERILPYMGEMSLLQLLYVFTRL